MSEYFKQTEALVMPVLEKHNKIGIMLSGGLDSGTLSWCLFKLITDNNLDKDVTVYTVPRTDNSLTHANKIRTILEQYFDIKIKHKIRGNKALHHSEQVNSGVISAMNENEIVFIAENRKPDDLQTDHFERIRWDGTGANVSQPWFDITKDVIVATAIECGLTDIMIHSHSCTETPLIRCNDCWWCSERAWAFNQNNYTDPGRY